jgi:hypothetical protein
MIAALLLFLIGPARRVGGRCRTRFFGRRTRSKRRGLSAFARPELRPFDRSDELATNGRSRLHLNERIRADGRSLCWCCVLSERNRRNEQHSEAKRRPHNLVPLLQKGRASAKISLPTCWRAPTPPVRWINQNRLIGPSIIPDPQFSTAWKAQWHNASLIKFANLLGSVATAQPDTTSLRA